MYSEEPMSAISEEYMDVELIATHYQIKSEWESMAPMSADIVRMNSPFYEGERWAVRRGSFCLGIDGLWELEPIPSSRDDEFYEKKSEARKRIDRAPDPKNYKVVEWAETYKELILKILADENILYWYTTEIDDPIPDIVEQIQDATPAELRVSGNPCGENSLGALIDMIVSDGLQNDIVTVDEWENAE